MYCPCPVATIAWPRPCMRLMTLDAPPSFEAASGGRASNEATCALVLDRGPRSALCHCACETVLAAPAIPAGLRAHVRAVRRGNKLQLAVPRVT